MRTKAFMNMPQSMKTRRDFFHWGINGLGATDNLTDPPTQFSPSTPGVELAAWDGENAEGEGRLTGQHLPACPRRPGAPARHTTTQVLPE